MKPPRRPMKDSGLKWVGQIPEEWEVSRLQSLLSEVSTENVGGRVKKALKFYMGTIVPKTNFDADTDAYVAKTIESYTVVKPNDIILNGLNLNFDLVSMRVAQVREEGAITSAYIPMRIKDSSRLNPFFANYLLKGYDFCKAFHNMGHGVRKILSYSELKKNKMLLPPLPEQRAIAARLDELTGRIESESKKIAAEIERLEQYKKSFITEAVCGRVAIVGAGGGNGTSGTTGTTAAETTATRGAPAQSRPVPEVAEVPGAPRRGCPVEPGDLVVHGMDGFDSLISALLKRNSKACLASF